MKRFIVPVLLILFCLSTAGAVNAQVYRDKAPKATPSSAKDQQKLAKKQAKLAAKQQKKQQKQIAKAEQKAAKNYKKHHGQS